MVQLQLQLAAKWAQSGHILGGTQVYPWLMGQQEWGMRFGQDPFSVVWCGPTPLNTCYDAHLMHRTGKPAVRPACWAGAG